jgi:hypothetical protein
MEIVLKFEEEGPNTYTSLEAQMHFEKDIVITCSDISERLR